MKINTTYALAGIALVAFLVHQSKKKAEAGSNGQTRPIESAGAWWTYAGMWGQS